MKKSVDITIRIILSPVIFLILIVVEYLISVFLFCGKIGKTIIPTSVFKSKWLIYCDDLTNPGILLYVLLPLLSGIIIYLTIWKNRKKQSSS
ncbi:MAG: hypothetical protein IH934_01350 [Nanoarchaeota archaeon]|nr:hypothetical protein [Nanoarchaeota archaeon]